MPAAHVVVAGASGVIGAAAVEHFSSLGWRVTALSRRRPIVAPSCAFTHAPVDFTDRAACAAALGSLHGVTHLIYAAVKEAPGLVSGWYDDALIAENGRMFEHVLDPLARAGALRHVSLLQGTKAYGAHHHPVEVPCREDRPRDDHPNFYWLHEDHANRRAREAGFGVAIFRPQIVLGGAPGAAMNPVAAIGAYAAIAAALGLPFAFPGKGPSVMEVVDAALIAEAFAWAAAAGATGIFNISNGDVMVLEHTWPHLAGALGLPAVGAAPANLAALFATPEAEAAWARLVAAHGLIVPTLAALLGESHHYLDLLTSARLADRAVPVMVSTIKLRQAGFAGCRDSLETILHWLRRMVALKLLPPFPAAA